MVVRLVCLLFATSVFSTIFAQDPHQNDVEHARFLQLGENEKDNLNYYNSAETQESSTDVINENTKTKRNVAVNPIKKNLYKFLFGKRFSYPRSQRFSTKSFVGDRVGSEFLGKRTGLGSEFLGKRVMGSEFLGKRALGSEFLGKRAMGSEFLGKRALGSEFLGKRAMGSEFLGKRAIGSEFLGKRAMGSEFLGKRAMGSEFLGKRAMGSEFLGKRAMGSEFLGKRGMGSEFLGKRAMGSEFLGKRAIGSEFLGKRAMGSEFFGKRGSEYLNNVVFDGRLPFNKVSTDEYPDYSMERQSNK